MFETGETLAYETNYQADGLDNYFKFSARRSGAHLLVSFTDTSDQDRSAVEAALRESQAREREARVKAEAIGAEIEAARSEWATVLEQAPALICIFRGPQHTFEFVNPLYQALVGERPLVGQPIAEALPELAGQPIFGLLDHVYQTGETFQAAEMLVQLDHANAGRGALEARYYNLSYQARRDRRGLIDGILAFAYDVTPQVQARQQVARLNEELAAINEELRASNDEYLQANTALSETQQQLRQLTHELEARVQARTQEASLAQRTAEVQRQRLEQLFRQAPAAICILDGPELVYELVNPTYQQLFPGRASQGKPLLEALPELTGQPVWHTLQRVYQTGQTHLELGICIPVARTEGGPLEDFYFNYIQQARYDAQGRIDGAVVFAFNVTAQVRASQQAEALQATLLATAQRQVQQREELYQIFEQAPAAIVLLREPGHRSRCSMASSGCRASWPYILDVTDRAKARQQAEQSQVEVQDLNQELASINEELLATNEELHQSNTRLTRTNHDLDTFVYTASHDLKAPITNIEGILHALRDTLPAAVQQDEVVAHVLGLLGHTVGRFRTTIDQLTDLTRLQQTYSAPAELLLAPVVAGVLADLAPQIAAAPAQVQVDVPAGLHVSFAPASLRSIVYNLLSNAVKYRAPERPAQVWLRAELQPGRMVLTVRDNGLGLTESQQTRLFGVFQRLHTHVEGTGVGLYMIKRLIENAGASITVTSSLGVGSTFTVTFPTK